MQSHGPLRLPPGFASADVMSWYLDAIIHRSIALAAIDVVGVIAPAAGGSSIQRSRWQEKRGDAREALGLRCIIALLRAPVRCSRLAVMRWCIIGCIGCIGRIGYILLRRRSTGRVLTPVQTCRDRQARGPLTLEANLKGRTLKGLVGATSVQLDQLHPHPSHQLSISPSSPAP